MTRLCLKSKVNTLILCWITFGKERYYILARYYITHTLQYKYSIRITTKTYVVINLNGKSSGFNPTTMKCDGTFFLINWTNSFLIVWYFGGEDNFILILI